MRICFLTFGVPKNLSNQFLEIIPKSITSYLCAYSLQQFLKPAIFQQEKMK